MQTLFNMEVETLHNKLTRLGDFYALNRRLENEDEVIHRLEESTHLWRKYNPKKNKNGRYGISLTSLDGGDSGIPDLDSIREFNEENGTSYDEVSFREKAEFFKK